MTIGKKMTKLPAFATPEEEIEFWATHSALEYMDEGEEVEIDASEARRRQGTSKGSLRHVKGLSVRSYLKEKRREVEHE